MTMSSPVFCSAFYGQKLLLFSPFLPSSSQLPVLAWNGKGGRAESPRHHLVKLSRSPGSPGGEIHFWRSRKTVFASLFLLLFRGRYGAHRIALGKGRVNDILYQSEREIEKKELPPIFLPDPLHLFICSSAKRPWRYRRGEDGRGINEQFSLPQFGWGCSRLSRRMGQWRAARMKEETTYGGWMEKEEEEENCCSFSFLSPSLFLPPNSPAETVLLLPHVAKRGVGVEVSARSEGHCVGWQTA